MSGARTFSLGIASKILKLAHFLSKFGAGFEPSPFLSARLQARVAQFELVKQDNIITVHPGSLRELSLSDLVRYVVHWPSQLSFLLMTA